MLIHTWPNAPGCAWKMNVAICSIELLHYSMNFMHHSHSQKAEILISEAVYLVSLL